MITKRHIILENAKVFENLEVSDELGRMTWHEAIVACKNLGKGWRLPTIKELDFLYQNKEDIGGFANNYYWSSTELEFDNLSVWGQHFFNDYQFSSLKVNNFYVRAVRAS